MLAVCCTGGCACDQCARRQALQAVHDHPLAGLHARDHDALAIHLGAQRDFAIFGLEILVHDKDEALALVVADGAFRHQDRIVERAATHPHRHEHAGHQAPSALSKRARARMVPEPVLMRLSKLSMVP